MTDRTGVIPIRSGRLQDDEFTIVLIRPVPSSLVKKLRNFIKLQKKQGSLDRVAIPLDNHPIEQPPDRVTVV